MGKLFLFLKKDLKPGFKVVVSLRVENSNENVYILRKLLQ